MSQEEGWLLPYPRDQFVQVVGRRTAVARLQLEFRCDIGQQAIFAVIDQFAFLALLDRLDRQAQLLRDLRMRHAVKVRYPRMHFNHRIDGAEQDFTRIFFIVDEGVGQDALVARRTIDFDRAFILHLVEAEDTGFDRHPFKEMDQPARRDGRKLGGCLGGVGQLARGDIAKRGGWGEIVGHENPEKIERRKKRLATLVGSSGMIDSTNQFSKSSQVQKS